ncbi:UPF0149 family protein [Falsiroseomonas sp. E2-1-a20]|uniref:UPF0149 family protein n=1 Tax=Falsiroseomonas sp. E2-1-a20 TaxID=3239300 RepID=UPI003F330BD9
MQAAEVRIAALEQIIKGFQRARFGQSSERVEVGQLALELGHMPVLPEPANDTPAKPRDRQDAGRRRRNRGALPAHLERIEEVLDLPDHGCPCCGIAMRRIGEDRSERLDVVPAQLRVRVTLRPRYACRRCEEGVHQLPAPARADQPDIARRNWTVSAISGFCAALIVGPERIATEAWLRMIFGPSLPTTPMGLAAAEAVLDHRNAVHRALHIDQGRRWSPIYMRTDDGTVLARPWAASFMFAVKRWPVAWRPMFERNDHVGLMLPIIACSEAEEVEKLIAGRPQEVRDHEGRAYHHVLEAVCGIRDYWRHLQTTR